MTLLVAGSFNSPGIILDASAFRITHQMTFTLLLLLAPPPPPSPPPHSPHSPFISTAVWHIVYFKRILNACMLHFKLWMSL